MDKRKRNSFGHFDSDFDDYIYRRGEYAHDNVRDIGAPRGSKATVALETLLPDCAYTWDERLPEPPPFPSDYSEIAEWIERYAIRLNLDQGLITLLPDLYQYLPRTYRWRHMPTVREILNTEVRSRLFPNNPEMAPLREAIIGVLKRFTINAAIRHQMAAKLALRAGDAEITVLTLALFAIWYQISKSAYSFPINATYQLGAGIESGAPIYRLGMVDLNAWMPYPTAPVRAQIGLWPEKPVDMLFSCSCGGAMDKPCAHLHLALERLLDATLNPAHPWHAPMTAHLSKPMWPATLTALGADTLFIQERSEVSAQAPSERLSWRIVRRGEKWSIEPAVQSLSSKGGWTKGRKVAIPQLNLSLRRGTVAPQDLDISEAAYQRDISWMRAAIGHPAIYDERDLATPVQVTQTSLELTVVPEGDWLRLGFMMGGRQRSAGEILRCLDESENIVGLFDTGVGRFFFAGVNEDEKRLIHTLMRAPTKIPAEKLTELTDILARQPGSVRIHLPKSLRSDTFSPNLTCVVRLEPEGDHGLSVALGFHLFNDAFFAIPGEGPEYIFHGVAGKPVGLSRNLVDERRMAREIAESLAVVELTPVGPWKYLAATVNDAFDLLTAVRALSMTHTVEWPKEATPWSVSSISARNARVDISGKKGQLFEIGVDVKIEDEEIALHQIMTALRSGTRYIPLGAGRFAMIEENLKEMVEHLDAVSMSQTKESIRLSSAAALHLNDQLGATEATITGDAGWLSFIDKIASVRHLQPRVSSAFNGTLRDYQKQGYYWLTRLKALGLGACLADDMGLGKTIQALALLLRKPGNRPSLVVAPTSVATNWMREAERFAPSLIPLFHHGAARDTDFAKLGGKHVVITTYDILFRDIEAFGQVEFETVIIDEAQVIKNAATKRAAAVRDLKAETKIALTGTPIENHLGELWSIFNAVVPGLLGTQHQFQRRFAVPIQKHGSDTHRHALAALIRPFVLRRTKAQVAPELPPRTETVQFVELYPEERKQYELTRRAVLAHLQDAPQRDSLDKERFSILSQIMRLRRLACHPRLVDESSLLASAKLDHIMSLIKDILEEKGRALIFSQFTTHLALVREGLDEAKIPYLYLDGATPAEKRGALVDAWRLSESDLFLISLKAGGTGLNLMGADYVLHLDPWWNPAVEDQATDRTHRIGQTKPVTVVRVIASATIEEAVIALHDKKRDLAESILQGTGTAGALSSEELIDLIRSGDETVK